MPNSILFNTDNKHSTYTTSHYGFQINTRRALNEHKHLLSDDNNLQIKPRLLLLK